jgi:hypothetical protein
MNTRLAPEILRFVGKNGLLAIICPTLLEVQHATVGPR